MRLTANYHGAAAATESQRAEKVPGEAGVWVFIFGDLLLFAYLFLLYLYYRTANPALFARSQHTLNNDLGVAYTLLLLTSSLFVVLALRRIRARDNRSSPRLVLVAIGCGVVFAGIKVLEYYTKIHEGITPAATDFFLLYYIVTGLHLAHLAIGIGVLAFMWRLAAQAPDLSLKRLRFAEGCACYWHMVDLLWLMIFPLLYLVR